MIRIGKAIRIVREARELRMGDVARYAGKTTLKTTDRKALVLIKAIEGVAAAERRLRSKLDSME
jgi:hypothetical protein